MWPIRGCAGQGMVFLPLRPKEGTYPSCESFLNRVYKSYL